MLYKDWLLDWLKNYVMPSLKDKTYNSYRDIVFNHLIPELGGNITVAGFHRFEKGEGIQKREENFADEIAKMTAGK